MKYSVFEFKLFLGKTCIQFISEIPLQITEEIQNFQAAHRSADIIVRICIKNQRIAKTNYCGEDLLLEYYKEDGHYRLQPENDTMDPIIVDRVEILGKLAGLYRTYR